MSSSAPIEADLAVVGAGAAGLYVSLVAAAEGATIALLAASSFAQTASYWAQGGLAAALSVEDSLEAHLRDTQIAGRALVRESAARVLCAEAPECVRELERLGVHFDADRHGQLALGLEGGHSVRRIVHAGGSATGRRVVRQLSALAATEPRIAILEHARATRTPVCGRTLRGRELRRRATSACARRRDLRRWGGRTVVADDEPAGLARDGHAAGARSRCAARGPRVHAVSPNRGDRGGGPRGLPDDGGDPWRGRPAARRRR